MNNLTSGRRIVVRLTDEEEYTLYKFVVENRCIAQTGEFIEFRVNREKIAAELNKLKIFDDRQINASHVKNAIYRVVGWQRLLDKIPAVTIETVEMDMLKTDHARDINIIEGQKLEISDLRKKLEQAQNGNSLQVNNLNAKIIKARAALA